MLNIKGPSSDPCGTPLKNKGNVYLYTLLSIWQVTQKS